MEKNQSNILRKDSKNSLKLVGLDGFRAIAILMVIFHHSSQFINKDILGYWGKEAINYLLVWNVSLSIFFVLSGFLLSYPFWRNFLNNKKFPSVLQYFKRRAARIMPGFYVALAASLIITVYLHVPIQYMLVRFLTAITFTSGYHYITLFPADLNTPLWSSSYEVFSYILLPFFMMGMYLFLRKRRSLKRALIYWFLVLVFMLFVNELVHIFFTPDNSGRGWEYGNIGGAKLWTPNYNPVGFFCQFTIGVIAAGFSLSLNKMTCELKNFKTRWFDIIAAFFYIGSFAFIWFARNLPDYSLSFQKQPFFFPVYPLCIGTSLAFIPLSNFVGKLLDNSFLRFTAKVSFGIYLWHYLVMNLFQKFLTDDFHYMGVNNSGRWIFITLSILAISYIIATFSYYIIEKPFMDKVYGNDLKANIYKEEKTLS